MNISTLSDLKKGDKITIVLIGGMAACFAYRGIFDGFRQIPGEEISGIFWKDNARSKKFHQFNLKSDNLLFPGHLPTPFVDSDTDRFWGNACLNLIGDPDKLTECIRENNLNPAFSAFGKVYYRSEGTDPDDAQPLYPDAV